MAEQNMAQSQLTVCTLSNFEADSCETCLCYCVPVTVLAPPMAALMAKPPV